jgi:hypothetical protein
MAASQLLARNTFSHCAQSCPAWEALPPSLLSPLIRPEGGRQQQAERLTIAPSKLPNPPVPCCWASKRNSGSTTSSEPWQPGMLGWLATPTTGAWLSASRLLNPSRNCLTAIDLHKRLVAEVEKANPWYYEVSKCAPQQALRNLEQALKRWRSGQGRFPRFKRKGVRDSFYLEGSIRISGNRIKVPILGWLRCAEILPTATPKNVVISCGLGGGTFPSSTRPHFCRWRRLETWWEWTWA